MLSFTLKIETTGDESQNPNARIPDKYLPILHIDLASITSLAYAT